MHAVIVSGGKQYRVQEGDILKLEKLPVEAGTTIDFNQVLMVGEGEKIQIGKPYLTGCVVKASVLEHGRHDKVRIIKFRRRKHHMKQMGHRQSYTQVKITAIKA
jgi:large subunit ribosomal protein L21